MCSTVESCLREGEGVFTVLLGELAISVLFGGANFVTKS
jgi:hypothetical protein